MDRTARMIVAHLKSSSGSRLVTWILQRKAWRRTGPRELSGGAVCWTDKICLALVLWTFLSWLLRREDIAKTVEEMKKMCLWGKMLEKKKWAQWLISSRSQTNPINSSQTPPPTTTRGNRLRRLTLGHVFVGTKVSRTSIWNERILCLLQAIVTIRARDAKPLTVAWATCRRRWILGCKWISEVTFFYDACTSLCSCCKPLILYGGVIHNIWVSFDVLLGQKRRCVHCCRL